MAAGLHGDAVKLALPTVAPQHGSAELFYAALLRELQIIQDTVLDRAHSSETDNFVACEQGDDANICKAAVYAEADHTLALATQLRAELHILWQLDESIRRSDSVNNILDAPPQLAPGPSISGPASAAVRLKQLRAAFVLRSQQVNMVHSSYRCVSRHNDLYKTFVRTSDEADKASLAAVDVHARANPATYSDTFSAASPATDNSAFAPESTGVSAVPLPHHNPKAQTFQGPLQHQSRSVPPLQPVSEFSSLHTTGHGGIHELKGQGSGPTPFGGGSNDSVDRGVARVPSSSGSSRSSSSTSSKQSNRSQGSYHSPLLLPSLSEELQPSSIRPESLAEKLVTVLPRRVRSGLLGLAGLLRWRDPKPSAPAQSQMQQSPSLQPGTIAGGVVQPMRRSFSAPDLTPRRCGVDLQDTAFATAHGSFLHLPDAAEPSSAQRVGRDTVRSSGERRAARRSRSEPPLGYSSRGGARDVARRAAFAMADVGESDSNEQFITPDLTTRVDIFTSV